MTHQEMFTKYSRDGFISQQSFYDLCKDLFLPGDHIKQECVQDVFNHYNKKQDGKMFEEEFQLCWKNWINSVLNPRTALLVVDVQNDFISGSLALKNTPAGQDGAEVVPVINRILSDCKFDQIAYSQDWHPTDHISFADNAKHRQFHSTSKISREDAKLYDTVVFATEPPTSQILWPVHCVQNTDGAKIHRDLEIVTEHILLRKGTHSDYDSYSSFFNNIGTMHTELNDRLRQRNITDVFCCGLAFDYCVRYTAMDARKLGYGTAVIEDGCKTISDEGYNATKQDFLREECLVISSQQLDEYLQRKVRHPDLAFSGFSPSTNGPPSTSDSRV